MFLINKLSYKGGEALKRDKFSWKKKNADPSNPYTPGTLRAALFEEDFSDLTLTQIAEVFDVKRQSVYDAAREIERKYDKQVEYIKEPLGRKRLDGKE